MNRSGSKIENKQRSRYGRFRVRKTLPVLLALVVLPAISAIAQTGQFDQKLATVKQVAAENKQKLHQYGWLETTQISVKGEQKSARRNSCRYDSDGRVQKTPLGPPPEAPEGGPLKKKIVEKKQEEMKDYLDDVKDVLEMYVPADPERMQEAYRAGNVAFNPVPGAMNLVFSNYAKPEDKLTLAFDPATKKITSLNIDTYMGKTKDKITVQVEMSVLPDGTSYAQQIILDVSSKKLTVVTTNSNYQKL